MDREVSLEDFSVVSYREFITDLREIIPYGDNRRDGIRLLLREPPRDRRFILVSLKADKKPVTFALRTTDVYVIGYQVDDEAHFFSDQIKPNLTENEKANIFNKTRLYHDLTYESGYAGDRGKIKLGVHALKEAASFFAEHPCDGNKEIVDKRSDMLMVVIQMVSEAVRFKYIEREMVDIGDGKKPPTDKMLYYENKWNKGEVRGLILKAAPGQVPEELRKDVYLIKPE